MSTEQEFNKYIDTLRERVRTLLYTAQAAEAANDPKIRSLSEFIAILAGPEGLKREDLFTRLGTLKISEFVASAAIAFGILEGILELDEDNRVKSAPSQQAPEPVDHEELHRQAHLNDLYWAIVWLGSHDTADLGPARVEFAYRVATERLSPDDLMRALK